MKKIIRKAMAVGFAAVFGLSVLTGCGAQAQEPVPAEPEEEVFEEEYVEEPEEPEVTETEEAEAEPAEEETEGEPAEGLSDQVLMNGYYGFWDGDTEYVFGVLSDKDFMINVMGASNPLLYAEGEYKDNGDGTYTATITSTDNDFAADQVINIKALGGPDIALTSDNAEVNKAVEGTYTHAGEKASDVESLK